MAIDIIISLLYNIKRCNLCSEVGVFEMFTNYVISTIQYIENNLQVEAIGATIIIALILLIILSSIFLVFRKTRLWYWRINDQIRALEQIDTCLELIKHNLSEDLNKEATKTLNGAEPLKQKTSLKEESTLKDNQVETKNEMPKIVFDKKDKCTITKHGYNIGKTGKIYAEEILREQIKF